MDTTFRWGVAGPGGIANRFAEAMKLIPDGEIAAVASRSLERANDFADKFSIPRRYGDYESLAADPSLDAVYVATPHSRHEADTLLFIEAGKHVLCEKPFALNARQAQHMVDAARSRGVFLMEAIWSRFLPAYRELGTVLSEGGVGEPLMVEADFGFRLPVMPEHRLFDPHLGGGALLDLGIYPLQLCSLVLGTPDRVLADGAVGSTGVDEQVAAVLHHRGGQLGVVKTAIRIPLSCTARISCSDGWIDLPQLMHCPDAIEVGGLAGTKRIDGSYEGDGLRFQIAEVQRCVQDGLTECPQMPLDETLSLAATMDDIRAQLGVVFPGEDAN